MRNDSSRNMALGGVLGALAVVIMCMGGLIPMATYICPMLCILLLSIVLRICGRRIAWGWYGAVALLSLLMGPDKEAAAVFAFLGYYPILKPKLDGMRLGLVCKLLLFNGSSCLMYWILIHVFGLEGVAEEFDALGTVMLAVLLLLGNVTFFMLDILLNRMNLLSLKKKQ